MYRFTLPIGLFIQDQNISGPGLLTQTTISSSSLNILTVIWNINVHSDGDYQIFVKGSNTPYQEFFFTLKCSSPPMNLVSLEYINTDLQYSQVTNTYFASFKLTGFNKYFVSYTTTFSIPVFGGNATAQFIQTVDYTGTFDIYYQIVLRPNPYNYVPVYQPFSSKIFFYDRDYNFTFNPIKWISPSLPKIAVSPVGTYDSYFIELTQSNIFTRTLRFNHSGFSYFPVMGSQSAATILVKGSMGRVYAQGIQLVVGLYMNDFTNLQVVETFTGLEIKPTGQLAASTTTCLNSTYSVSIFVGTYKYFVLSNGFYSALTSAIPSPAPYGHISGNTNNMDFLTQSVVSKTLGSISTYINGYASSNCLFSSVSFPDTSVPSVTGISVKRVSPTSPFFKVQFQVTDDASGFALVSFRRSGYIQLTIIADNSNIISGTFLNGTVEFQLDSRNYEILALTQFEIFDNNGGAVSIHSNFDNLYSNYISLGNITYFKFKESTITYNNLVINYSTAKPFKNTLFYNVTYRNDNIPISLSIPNQLFSEQNQYFPSYWDDSINMYRIDFEVPYNFFSQNLYYQLINPTSQPTTNVLVSSDTLAAYFGNDAIIRVESVNADQLPPLVTNVSHIITVQGNTITLLIKLTIQDQVNGLDKGKVVFTSDLDPIGYTFEFTSDKRFLNQMYDYTYSFPIQFNVSTCANQNFSISYFEAVDTMGRKGVYDKLAYLDNGINPIYKIFDSPSQFMPIAQCSGPVDGNLPYIDAISIDNNPTINVVSGQFTIKDDTSGLLIGRYPICYLSSSFDRIISAKSTCTYTLEKVAICKCIITVPYKFGYPDGYLFSIYGIYDNQLNFRGYTQIQLSLVNSSIPTYSLPHKTYDNPIIESIDLYYNNQTEIFIHGQILATNIGVSISNVSLNPLDVFLNFGQQNNVYLQINLKRPLNETFNIQLYLLSDPSKTSKLVIITPLVPPILGKCPNDCGGSDQGICTSSGCQCKIPWYGDDCRSRVINTTKPETNTTSPTTGQEYEEELPTGEKVNLSTLISIVGLRELDINGNQIREIPFGDWIYQNISNLREIKYLYTTSFKSIQNNSELVTNVTVTTQWFTSVESISFAGENFKIYPSTMKYSVTMSQYYFKSRLSKLQLVFSASIISKNKDQICSSKEFQESANTEIESEFIKLSLNSHSLYGRFIKRAIIDDRITIIDNSLLDSKASTLIPEKSESLIAINIPFYYTSATLDPDFSMLVDVTSNADNENSICSSSSKKGLTTAQLIGIIIGSVGGFVILVLIIGALVYKRMKYSNWFLGIKDKMKKSNEQKESKKNTSKLQRIRRSIAPMYMGSKIHEVDKF